MHTCEHSFETATGKLRFLFNLLGCGVLPSAIVEIKGLFPIVQADGWPLSQPETITFPPHAPDGKRPCQVVTSSCEAESAGKGAECVAAARFAIRRGR